MRLLINLASRSRPKKFLNCLRNLRDFSTLKNYLVLAKLDTDDEATHTAEMKEELQYFPEVQVEWGLSESKVGAINRQIGAAREMWDILINLSDDQLFLVPGFDKIIVDDMRQHFPDTDGFLHYPDSHTGNKIPTMSIIGRKYYERDGYVYEPSLFNVYCDNFAMDMAKNRKKYVFINKTIYDHFHPVWKMGEWDDQYRRTDSKESFARDREIYMKLRQQYLL